VCERVCVFESVLDTLHTLHTPHTIPTHHTLHLTVLPIRKREAKKHVLGILWIAHTHPVVPIDVFQLVWIIHFEVRLACVCVCVCVCEIYMEMHI
jgi:hypothetical protein